jgi:cyclopropane fatty-acyl-phospholipid synthase-like methyltransferase
MTESTTFYDGHYGHLADDPLVDVRRQTYDEDLGQAGWLTLAEARGFFRMLELEPGRTALEVACGSGGITCRMALETGATCVGIQGSGISYQLPSTRDQAGTGTREQRTW